MFDSCINFGVSLPHQAGPQAIPVKWIRVALDLSLLFLNILIVSFFFFWERLDMPRGNDR